MPATVTAAADGIKTILANLPNYGDLMTKHADEVEAELKSVTTALDALYKGLDEKLAGRLKDMPKVDAAKRRNAAIDLIATVRNYRSQVNALEPGSDAVSVRGRNVGHAKDYLSRLLKKIEDALAALRDDTGNAAKLKAVTDESAKWSGLKKQLQDDAKKEIDPLLKECKEHPAVAAKWDKIIRDKLPLAAFDAFRVLDGTDTPAGAAQARKAAGKLRQIYAALYATVEDFRLKGPAVMDPFRHDAGALGMRLLAHFRVLDVALQKVEALGPL